MAKTLQVVYKLFNTDDVDVVHPSRNIIIPPFTQSTLQTQFTLYIVPPLQTVHQSHSSLLTHSLPCTQCVFQKIVIKVLVILIYIIYCGQLQHTARLDHSMQATVQKNVFLLTASTDQRPQTVYHYHTTLFKVPHHPLQSTTPPSSKYHTTLFKVPYHPLQSTIPPIL